MYVLLRTSAVEDDAIPFPFSWTLSFFSSDVPSLPPYVSHKSRSSFYPAATTTGAQSVKSQGNTGGREGIVRTPTQPKVKEDLEKRREEKNGKGDQRSDGERIVLLVRGLFLPIVDVVLLFPLLQVIAAEGEQKASRALREASEVIADTPAALQLRYLQVNQSSRKAQLNQLGVFL